MHIPDGRIAHTLTACTRCRQVSLGYQASNGMACNPSFVRRPLMCGFCDSANPDAIREFHDASHVNGAMQDVYTTILPGIVPFLGRIFYS